VIRVRGENVSAFEVEEVISQVHGVLEVAAVAVPAELGGDEVKVVVVARAGAKVDPHALIAHAAAKLPRFAIPRYVEVVDALPKTETNKVRKNVLRATPFTPGTWDRMSAAQSIQQSNGKMGAN
jgi:crotonobetaine/carnitine-CoA ligase